MTANEAQEKLQQLKENHSDVKICGICQSTLWYFASVIMFVLVAVAAVMGKQTPQLPDKTDQDVAFNGGTVEQVEQANPTPSVRLDYYGATWCGPCKKLKPTLEALAKKGHEITFHDIDKEPRPGDVSAVPALRWHKFGKHVETEIGLRTSGQLTEKFEEIEGSIFVK